MKPLAFLATLLAVNALAADFPPPDQFPAVASLPDPLVMRDATRVSTKEQWVAKRAPELRALFAHYMYGARPQSRPIKGELVREAVWLHTPPHFAREIGQRFVVDAVPFLTPDRLEDENENLGLTGCDAE